MLFWRNLALFLVANGIRTLASPFEASGGAKVAFAGHSYFIPVAGQFNEIASASPELFPNHSYEEVFRGDLDGAPGNLWMNDRDEVESMLVGGDVQLFGLTVHEENSGVEDFKNWFDRALLYNTATQFLIAIPWVIGSPAMTTAELEAESVGWCDGAWSDLVQQLRADYPNNAVHFICYSYVNHKLRYYWDDDNLPDVTKFIGSDTTGLYTDDHGHGGDYMEHVMGLLWLDWLYGVPSGSSLADISAATGNNYDTTIIEDVINEVLSEQSAYRLDDTYSTDPVPGPGNPDYQDPDSGGGARPFSCFSGESLVDVQGEGYLLMKNLKVGDSVKTRTGYSLVYALGHWDHLAVGEFLQMHTEGNNKPLEITAEHMIYVKGRMGAIRADSVIVGDKVLVANSDSAATVMRISKVDRRGLYSPLTIDGSIVVDNVIASSYVAIQQHDNEFVEINGVAIPITQSFGIHLILMPLRLWCGSNKGGAYCSSYTEDNYHVYAKFFLELGEWVDQQGVFIQLSMFFITAFGIFLLCVGIPFAKLALMNTTGTVGAIIVSVVAQRSISMISKN